jgi:hypothetical protein
MIAGVDRFAQPLHNEFDIVRLQNAPALNLGLILILWEALEVFHRKLPGRRTYSGELVPDERVLRHSEPSSPTSPTREATWRKGARRAGRIARGAPSISAVTILQDMSARCGRDRVMPPHSIRFDTGSVSLHLRCPQCVSFRDGLNTRSTRRFNDFMTPMRANIAGPPCSATSNSASIGACYSSASCCLGQFGDELRRVAERDQGFPTRHHDRIEKPLVPRHQIRPLGYDQANNRPAWGTSFGRSASNTSQIVRSVNSGWRCALA